MRLESSRWTPFHTLMHVKGIQIRWYSITKDVKHTAVTVKRFKWNVTLCYIEMSSKKEWEESLIVACFVFEKSEEEFVRKFIKLKTAPTTKGSTLNSNLALESFTLNLFVTENQIKIKHSKSVVLGKSQQETYIAKSKRKISCVYDIDWYGYYLVLDHYYLLNPTNNSMNITISHIYLIVVYMKSTCLCDSNDIQHAIPLSQRFCKILKMYNFFTEKFQILK